MNEGIVEGGEDTGNAENELACKDILVRIDSPKTDAENCKMVRIPSPARGPRVTFSLAAAGALVLGAIVSTC